MATQLVTTASSFAGGSAAQTGQGQKIRVTFGGTWATNDTYLLVNVFNTTGIAERFGAGALTNKDMNYLLTYNQKQNVLAEQTWYFSEVDDSTIYNDPDGVGNGDVKLANSLGISEDLVAIAPFQDRMAVFCPNSTQIWQTGADPENYGKVQVLQGVGTSAPESVRGLGMLDVLFMQGGFRSLRARSNDLAAEPSDIGTPIDQLVLEAIDNGASEAGCCSVNEPRTKRYWGFLGDRFYVLSFFPQSNITAWSTYLAKASIKMAGGSFDVAGTLRISVGPSVTCYWTKGNATGLAADAVPSSMSATGYFAITSSGDDILISGPPSTLWTGTLFIVSQFSTFVPTKIVVQDNVIYMVGTDNKIYAYGGSSGLLYDCTQASGQVPWLNDNTPMTLKQFQAIDVAMKGQWLIECGADPTSGTLASIWNGGSSSTPNTQIDSTFDALRIPCEIQGTHFTLKFTSSLNSYKLCRFSGINVLYQQLETT